MSIGKKQDTIGLRIAKVLEGSIAEELGLEIGDIIISVNGNLVDDVVEYNFLIADENLEVEIFTKQGESCILEIEKDFDEELGVEFEVDLLDTANSCNNKCIFCFIDQLPKGMRKSLYFKDDDTRLSFIHGSFVTLTNLKQQDLEKIVKYRISPLNVSVHSTNPELREKMLNNRFAGKIIEQIKYLTHNNIEINCQIVLCPSVNDGMELDRTIKDLAEFYPMVHSVAIVPVGLTDYREGLFELKKVDKDIAEKLIEQVEKFQIGFLDEIGTKFVYLADEIFIMAKKDIPEYEYYEDFPQIENGVGLIASFKDEFECGLQEFAHCKPKPKTISIATGELAYNFMCDIAQMIEEHYNSLSVKVYKIENNFFGKDITVSGLITGKDLINTLKNKELGKEVFISSSMLKQDEDVFLDDITLIQAEKELEVKIIPTTSGLEFIEKILNIT